MKPILFSRLRTVKCVIFTLLAQGIISCNGNAEKNNKVAFLPADSSAREKPVIFIEKASRYIAGLKQERENEMSGYEKCRAWKKYAILSDSSWNKIQREKLSVMQSWANKEVPQQQNTEQTVLYPFSGPDFLHAVTLFPNAKNYILMGLEPTGKLPAEEEFKKDSLKNYFPAIERSLRDVLNFSFFKTNNMAVDLKGRELDGSLPLLSIFLERSGNRITGIDSLNFRAEAHSGLAANKTAVKGIRISFEKNGKNKTLYYFSLDLTDYALQKQKTFISFLNQYKDVYCFLKSASYLMYRPNFSLIRQVILNNSGYILQDDSGIAFKDLDENTWTLKFYGKYQVPIYLFTKFYDTALHDRFRKEAKPLPFGIGYHWRENESGLISATRKK